MGLIRINNSSIDKKDHRRLEFKDFRGVDYSVPKLNVAHNHASHLRNITNKNGINCKRNGWTIEYKLPNGGRVNGYWEFELNNTLFKVCYVGTEFYVRNSDKEEWKRLDVPATLKDQKTQMYINGNRAYFIGCGDFLVLSRRDGESVYTLRSVVDDSDTYIPITTAQISHTDSDINTSRYTRDDDNLLTGWRRNTLVGDNANGKNLSYMLDDTFTVKDGTVPILKIENTDEHIGEYKGEKVAEGEITVTNAVIVRQDKKALTLNPVIDEIKSYLLNDQCYPTAGNYANMSVGEYGNWMIKFANKNNSNDYLGYRWQLRSIKVSDNVVTDKKLTEQNFLDHKEEDAKEKIEIGDYGIAEISEETVVSTINIAAPTIKVTTSNTDSAMNIELNNPCNEIISAAYVYAYYAESPSPNAANTYTNKIQLGSFDSKTFTLNTGDAIENFIANRSSLRGYISFYYTAIVEGKEIRSAATCVDLTNQTTYGIEASDSYEKYFITKTHNETFEKTVTAIKTDTTIEYYKKNVKYETKQEKYIEWGLFYAEYKSGILRGGEWQAASKKYKNTTYANENLIEEIDGVNTITRKAISEKVRTDKKVVCVEKIYYVYEDNKITETVDTVQKSVSENEGVFSEYVHKDTEIIGEVNTELVEIDPDYTAATYELLDSADEYTSFAITMPNYVSSLQLDVTETDDAIKTENPNNEVTIPYKYATTFYGFIPYDSDSENGNDSYYITLEANVLVIHAGCNLKPKLPGANLTLTYYESSPNPEVITNAVLSTIYGVDGATDMLFVAKDNITFHSEMSDFTYFPNRYTRSYGSENTKIQSFIRATDGSLIVLKERSEYEPSVYITKGSWINGFYDLEETEPYTLPSFSANGSVSPQGCIAPYASDSLNNDSLFLSENGVFAVELSDVTSSQRFIRERSTPINKVLTEIDKSVLAEAIAIAQNNKFYLALGNNVYVADGHYSFIPEGSMKDTFSYEWYYWDNFPVRLWFIKDGHLWFGTNDGKLCRLTNDKYYDTTDKIWFGVESKIRQGGVVHTMTASTNGFVFDSKLRVRPGDIIIWRDSEYKIKEIGAEIITEPMPIVTNESGIPDIDAVIERRETVTAEYYTPITDFGSSAYNKTMLSFTIALAGDLNNNVNFGYTTKKADVEKIAAMTMIDNILSKMSASGSDEQQQGEFDFSGFGFTDFSFDTAFQSSFTKRTTVPKFNYMIFKFENNVPTNMAVSSLSIEYKIEGQNWGVK